MHLIIILILALAAPVAASPGGATGAVGLRYRVSPGEAYAHQVDLHVQIRALSPKDTPLPKHLEAGTNGWVGGRVTTLIGQRTGMATHEVVQVARLQTKHAGRTQELPRAMPAIHLVTPHGIRESAGGPGATSDSSPWGGSGSSILDPLPDAVLVPGEKWSRTLQARVPGGPAVNLETVSRYLGPRQLDGAACALIESRSNLPSLRFSDQSAAGTLTGTVELLTYHDLDTGVPRRSDGKMHWRLAFTGPKGNEAQVSIQMAIAIRQVPTTQWERGLARRAADSGAAHAVALLTPPRQAVPTRPPAPSARLAKPPPAAPAPVPASPPSPPIAVLSPRPGEAVRGECLITASVAEDLAPDFIVFTVDGARVAAANTRPFTHRLAKGALSPGTHTLGVEAYRKSHLPVARARIRIRVPKE